MSEPWLLALDTATSVVVVVAGTAAGEVLAVLTFPAGHRHGTHLLPTIEQLRREAGLQLDDLGGVIVGTGPGAFTGLRVGLATAKTLAHARGIPIVGVSTAEALLAAAREAGAPPEATLAVPAGPHDRVEVPPGGPPTLVSAPLEEADGPRRTLVAVDLEGRADAAALELGRRSVAGLPVALLRLGAARLQHRDVDDVARVVPEYVTLPRGVRSEATGGVAWSRDPR